jgi:uncharacterized protein YxjI
MGMLFELRQKLIAFGDDFEVKDEAGNDQFYFDGKVGRIQKTTHVIGPKKEQIATITQNLLTFTPTFTIRAGKEIIATVYKKMFTFRPVFVVAQPEADPITITGKVLEHEYLAVRGKDEVATVSKRWFRRADTYGVEIRKPRDYLIMLSAAVIIDTVLHPKKKS